MFSTIKGVSVQKALTALVFVLLFVHVSAFPSNASDTEIVNALAYLKTEQTSDGCIGGFATSAWVISSVVAAGENPSSASWSTNNTSLVDCIKKDSTWFNASSRSATDFERQIIAIVAAGHDPKQFNGLDYVAKLKSFYDGTQMGAPSLLNDDTFGIIALIAANESPSSTEIQGMLAYLEANQGTDNGWSWGRGQESDTDSTADTIMAFIAAGRSAGNANIQNARAYLKSVQDTSNAGFTSFGSANPDTTAHSIDAIYALGENPGDAAWMENSTDSVHYLLTWQQQDGGFSNPFANPAGTSSSWTTANALNALLGKPYPVKILQTVRMAIRIEDTDQTVADETVTLPPFLEFTADSGTIYTLSEPSLLMGLLQAAENNNFSVTVGDQFYPGLGFYVSEIAGHAAEGFDGWNFRVDDHGTGSHASNTFIWQESNPPTSPHDSVVWFYGSWDAKTLRITASTAAVTANQAVEVTVEYFNEADESWNSLEGATVYGAATQQTTDSDGKATIRFATQGTQFVYAEKSDAAYYRSEKLQFTVSPEQQNSQQQFNSSVFMTGELISTVAFSVDASSIDFGSFGPGYTVSGNDITLINTGSWDLEIDAEVVDNSGTLYSQSLLLNNNPWQNFVVQVAANTNNFAGRVLVSLGLAVPSDYSGTGTQTGTLIFWATSTGSPA